MVPKVCWGVFLHLYKFIVTFVDEDMLYSVLQSSINLVHSILRKHFRASNIGTNDPHPAQLPIQHSSI